MTVMVVIISAVLIMYYVVYSSFDANAKEKDITVVHETILEGNYNSKVQYETFQNLRGSDHFVYKNGKCMNLMMYIREKNNRTESGKGMPKHPGFDSKKLENVFSKLVQPGADALTLREKAYGRKFIVIISEYEGGYLISAVPYGYDNRLMYTMLISGLIFMIIGLFVSMYVANYMAKPIRNLEEFAGRISVKDFSKPMTVQSKDEFGRLTVSMNRMQESLKRAEEEEKQFLQSISHDLKTPVMVIMSHADAIIDGMYVDSLENTADIIKKEASGLNKKIRGLLYLNTLDYVLENQEHTEEIELSSVIRNIIERFRLIREGIIFKTDLEKCSFICDGEKIAVAVENILDNAIRFAVQYVEVSMKTDGEKICIDIFNDGESIKEEDTSRIFDNMYKAKKGNFGLGLAITKKIISFYNGSVSAENVPGGVRFRIVL